MSHIGYCGCDACLINDGNMTNEPQKYVPGDDIKGVFVSEKMEKEITEEINKIFTMLDDPSKCIGCPCLSMSAF